MVSEETRIVGNLPNLHLEILHRQDPEVGTEHITIHLTGHPSLRAAESLMLGGLGGFSALPGPNPEAWANPWAAWTHMAQAMMAPWLGVWSSLPWMPPQASFITRR